MTRPRVLFCGLEFSDGFNHTKSFVEERGLDVDVVRCPRERVLDEIRDADVAVPLMTTLDGDALSRGASGRLRLVLQFGVGLEGVDVDAASRHGVRVARIPSEKTGNATSTAEMAVYLLLAALRRHDDMRASVERRALGAPTGTALEDCEVLILGWGAIGVKIAERLRGFGCSMTAARRSEWRDDESDRCGASLRAMCSTSDAGTFATLLGAADAVCVACTQDASNKGMIDAAFLGAMKPGAVLVNVARGGLFNRDDILDALESGRLGYLASDVAWSEPVDPNDAVVKHPRSYFTPHVGGVCHGSYKTMGRIVATWSSRLSEIESSDDIQLVN